MMNKAIRKALNAAAGIAPPAPRVSKPFKDPPPATRLGQEDSEPGRATLVQRNRKADGGYIPREPLEKSLGEYITKTPRGEALAKLPNQPRYETSDLSRLTALRQLEGRAVYPGLWRNVDPIIKQNMGRSFGYGETFVPTEEGDVNNPRNTRPPEFGPAWEHGRTGVEIYRPDMTGADVAQELLHADPYSHDTRAKMLKSLSPEQRQILAEGSNDFKDSLAEGQTEQRAYQNAMDGALRNYIANRAGAAHHQAPQEAVDEMNYTDEQKKILEHLYDYTQRGKYANGVQVHGGSGGNGMVTLDDSLGNEFSHEVGHNYGLGHYVDGFKGSVHRSADQVNSTWGWDADKGRFLPNFAPVASGKDTVRSEEHTSELKSH